MLRSTLTGTAYATRNRSFQITTHFVGLVIWGKRETALQREREKTLGESFVLSPRPPLSDQGAGYAPPLGFPATGDEGRKTRDERTRAYYVTPAADATGNRKDGNGSTHPFVILSAAKNLAASAAFFVSIPPIESPA